MEEDEYRFTCFIPLRLRWQFCPDVQSEAVLALLVPKMRRELVEDVKAITGKVGKRRYRRNIRRAVCVLLSVSVPRFQFHLTDTD
jgi:hypothetical protein